MNEPRIAVTGGQGQLGQTLQSLVKQSELSARISILARSELDIVDLNAVNQVLGDINPDVVINGAAYTAVDKAETESDLAFAVNATGCENLALFARKNGTWLIHISTDFVFDGKANTPYIPESATAPLGVYGASKLAGERVLVRENAEQTTIVRTSWLYSEYGHNFVKTMLRLMEEKEELGIVDDQMGSPTSTHSLARLLLTMARHAAQPGIYHWNDGGAITWFEFAKSIRQFGLELGLLENPAHLTPISTADYPTPATRPAYSVLSRQSTIDTFGVRPSNWSDELRSVLNALR